MLQPKRTKYRKQFKGRNAGLAHRGSNVSFGEFGLKATSRARMTAREIEAARRAMARYVKRGGQIWIRVFPDVPITKKPLEVRMGSRQGQRRVLRGARAARQGVVRDGRRGRGDGARGVPPGRLEALRVHLLRETAGALDGRQRAARPSPPPSSPTSCVKLRKEQFALRMQRATGQAAKPDQFGKVRRNIARLKTVLREQQRRRRQVTQ